MRPRILVSACLLGRPVRYDGRAKPFAHPLLTQWERDGWLVPLCPEMAAGLPTPRTPAEIAPKSTAEAVLDGNGRVFDRSGNDVTAIFLDAANRTLNTARDNACAYALLTDGSPTCGSRAVYDGRFQGGKQPGAGLAAALLRRHGIAVFAEDEIAALADRIAADAI